MFTLDSIKEFFDNQPRPFILYKNYKFINAKGIYTNNLNLFSPQVLEGRPLNSDDFINNSNVCIVDEKIKKNLYSLNGDLFCSVENATSLKVGVFSNTNLSSRNNSSLYFNLFSTELLDTGIALGEYILDGGNESLILLNELTKYITDLDDNIIIQSKSITDVYNNLSTQAIFEEYFTITIIVFTLLLMIINIFQCISGWILSKKDEILARIICGANKIDILKLLLKQYLLLLLISFSIGGGISLSVINIVSELQIPVQLQCIANLATFCAILTIGCVFGFLCIMKFLSLNQSINIFLRRT